MKWEKIPCYIIRGGTSKGIYFLEKDLPTQKDERDRLLLRIMGSPDEKQIDGLGGAVSVTSKVAILSPSQREGVDVDYTFAQVSVDKPVVSYAGNCGNISSGVGPFAIESGLVKASSPETTVRIFNTNTKKLLAETVHTPDGIVEYAGTYKIAGVPGTAAPIRMTFLGPAGSVFNSLLPTGNTKDSLNVPDFGKLTVSIVDATNPLVFVRAADIGLTGLELPREIDGSPEKLELLEKIRGVAAQKLGLIDDYRESSLKTPGIPKMTFVSAPASYTATTGERIHAERIDLLGRMMSMQKAHPTYALTGAMCTAAAAVVPGTIVNQSISPGFNPEHIHIGHPGGILEAGVNYKTEPDGTIAVTATFGYRTARLLMKGIAYCGNNPDKEH